MTRAELQHLGNVQANTPSVRASGEDACPKKPVAVQTHGGTVYILERQYPTGDGVRRHGGQMFE